MTEVERELTFLAKYLPEDLTNFQSEIIEDTYIPEYADHAVLRLRRKGDKYEITKKEPVEGKDSSRQQEYTIQLSPQEYEVLAASFAKSFKKRRFYYKVDGYDAEVDVYMDKLVGLVAVDFEFDNDEAMSGFTVPEMCLVDVTQDAWVAGGKISGKSYSDIKHVLDKYGYKPLKLIGVET